MAQHSTRLLRRLNPYCTQALSAAATLCQSRAHAQVTIEHWLLKLLEQGEGDLTLIARRYEWDMDALWRGLIDHLDTLPRSVQNKPQLCGKLQQLIKNAWLLASLDGNNETLRSAHLLGALLETPSLLVCDATWPLLSISDAQLQRLLVLLDQHSEERAQAQQEAARDHSELPALSGTDEPDALKVILDKFTHDLTAKARAGQIDPVFGREDEIRQVIDILSRRRKNNPILVGEPGVGETALVEGLALRIVVGNVPVSVKQVAIRTLDLGLFQAGGGVKGEFEQRLKNVIEAVQQSPTPILLFIDEAHTLIGAGNTAGGADAANLLKPALARGELRTIAATTWSEYKQYFERDAALERRFQMVKVDEPDDEAACLMLRGLKERYATHHGVHITDAAVGAAVRLSRRYLTGRQLPDKAVDLLDTAAARVKISSEATPVAIATLSAERAALEVERAALLADSGAISLDVTEPLLRIDARLVVLTAELTGLEQALAAQKEAAAHLMALRQQWQTTEETSARNDLQMAIKTAHAALPKDGAALVYAEVDEAAVARVIADWTGVPVGNLLLDELTTLLDLETQLSRVVVGQDEALEALGKRLRAAKAGLTSEEAPLGVFLLVGPSGVGKTETARAL